MVNRDIRQRWRVVDKSLQYKFLAMMLIYSFIIVIFLAAFLFLPDVLKINDETLSLEIRAVAADRLITMHVWVWPFIVIMVFIIGGHSFLSFQRIAGPLYRFRRTFEKIRDGDLEYPIKIRDKDYLYREEETLNEMLKILGGKLESIQQAGRDLLTSLDELEQKLTASSHLEEIDQKLLRTHREFLDELLESAEYFRLPRPEDKQ